MPATPQQFPRLCPFSSGWKLRQQTFGALQFTSERVRAPLTMMHCPNSAENERGKKREQKGKERRKRGRRRTEVSQLDSKGGEGGTGARRGKRGGGGRKKLLEVY